MKSWWKVAFGILCGLLGGGLIYLVSSPPRGVPVQLLPLPSPAPIQVYVTGAVVHPGVYALPAGSRIEQAIQEQPEALLRRQTCKRSTWLQSWKMAAGW